jgi:hypothetical protein
MGLPTNKDEERELLDLLGAIAAGECNAVLIVAERVTAAGEVSLVVRLGGTDEEGARRMVIAGLWSDAMQKPGGQPDEKKDGKEKAS